MRNELKKRRIKRLKVVFSTENAIPPQADVSDADTDAGFEDTSGTTPERQKLARKGEIKKKTPGSNAWKIVQDADRIDAIGAIGIARTFAYGGRVGRSIESSLQHFHDKLLLLKDELNTEAAKKLAESRHAYMEEFLVEFHKESGM